jgi:outer membrane protein
MPKPLFVPALVSAVLIGGLAPAQADDTPAFFDAGSILVRARADAVIPENFSSSISEIGGSVKGTTDFIPELDLSYFLTPKLSVEAIAGSSEHMISAQNSALGPQVDVGKIWVLPPTVTLQYHQQVRNFIPYAGVGLTVMIFYASQPDHGNGITKVDYSNSAGPALNAGFDYVVAPHWVLNFDVKQMFVNTTAKINGVITAKTALSPTVAGVGIGYRF